MAELVCLTALGVVSLFTGIVSLGNSDAFMGMFTFMILLVSYALIILTFRKRRTLFKAKEVIYTGYEIYLYILSYIVLMTSCLLIYLHVCSSCFNDITINYGDMACTTCCLFNV